MVAYFSVFKLFYTVSEMEVKSLSLYIPNAFSIPGIFATASKTYVRLPVVYSSPYSSRRDSKIGSLTKISSPSVSFMTFSYNNYTLLSEIVSSITLVSSIMLVGSSSLQYYPTMGTTT